VAASAFFISPYLQRCGSINWAGGIRVCGAGRHRFMLRNVGRIAGFVRVGDHLRRWRFLAPILTSTGGGNHVALFSYAVLDAGILAIAYYKHGASSIWLVSHLPS
jgi:hypothetical protein